jgi:hypothetical protein
LIGFRANFVEGNLLLVASKRIVFSQEQHAVALVALLHRHTGAVPVGGFGLGLFVFVMATGTKGRTQVIFVLCQPFKITTAVTPRSAQK